MDLLKVGDVKEFTIISLDKARGRIGLSLKTAEESGATRPGSARPGATRSGSAPGGEANRVAGSAVPQGAGKGAGPAAPASQPRPRPSSPAPERPQPQGGAARSDRQEHPDRTNRPDRGQRDDRRPREDDGMTYNPFADLLKNRK